MTRIPALHSKAKAAAIHQTNTPHTMAKQTLHSSYLPIGFTYHYQANLFDMACSGTGYRPG